VYCSRHACLRVEHINSYVIPAAEFASLLFSLFPPPCAAPTTSAKASTRLWAKLSPHQNSAEAPDTPAWPWGWGIPDAAGMTAGVEFSAESSDLSAWLRGARIPACAGVTELSAAERGFYKETRTVISRCGCYESRYPPSTTMFAPVMKSAAAPARKRTTRATSSGSPILFSGTRWIQP
jgi:hypothetical protein